MYKNDKMIKVMDKLGFSHIQTGGGCTAWYTVTKDDQVILITDQDVSAPMSMDDPCYIGFWDYKSYMAGNEENDIREFQRFGTVPVKLLTHGIKI